MSLILDLSEIVKSSLEYKLVLATSFDHSDLAAAIEPEHVSGILIHLNSPVSSNPHFLVRVLYVSCE